jgi:hypothetical protein
MSFPTILYDSRFHDSAAVITANSCAANGPVANLADYRSYTFWQGVSVAATHIIDIDLGASTGAINCIGFVGHNLKTADATISVQYSIDATNYTTALTATTLPAASSDLPFLRTLDSSISARRYFRVTIQTAAVAPKIGCIFLGDKLTFPANPTIPLTPYSLGMEVESQLSKTGYLLGSVVRHKPVKMNFTILPSENNATWFQSTYKTFWLNHGSEGRPFFFALDTAAFPNDAWWVSLDNAQYATPMSMSSRVEGFSIQLKGIYE